MPWFPRSGSVRALAATAVWAAYAAPAAAQPYVYAVTTTDRSTFPASSHFETAVTPRLVTVDPVAGQAIASLPLTGCTGVSGVAVRNDGTRVYVACPAANSTGAVLVLDPIAKQIVASRTLPTSAMGIALTPSGDRLVVGRTQASSFVLDSASLQTLGSIPAGARMVAATDSTAYLGEAFFFQGGVSVVDLTTFASVKTFSFSGRDNVVALALTGDGSRLAIAQRDQTVSIINTSTNAVDAKIALPPNVGALSAAADESRHVFVGTTSGVAVIDLVSNAVTGQLPPSGAASKIALSAAGDRLYASIWPTDLTTVNTAAGSTTSSAALKGQVWDLRSSATSPIIAADACSYVLLPHVNGGSAAVPLESAAGTSDWSIDVIALPDRCAWTAQSSVPWITFSGASNTGPDNVGFTVAPNTSGVARSGVITIGGQTLTINQAGCSNPIIFFERPLNSGVTAQPYQVSGWAIDTCAPSGAGISDPSGTMGYGRSRPDVGAAFGAQFTNSGFQFRDTFERRPGFQDVTISFRDAVTGNTVSGTTTAYFQGSIAPFGALDTPADGQVVAGDMALTGWAMDDVGILGNILVYRDSLPGEPSSPGTPGKLFVGVAARTPGARPDVQALFPNYADNDRAGFGLMVLTNALPNNGNGTFTFHVQIADRYNVTWLGPRTVTVDNASSPLPFGAIDTPTPGQTVSGTIAVQGWALTPGSGMIPVDGSTIDVVVDGVVVGHPVYNQWRSDVQGLFPAYTNAAGAGGALVLDTRTLANGVHTLAWVVRDNAGHVRGIGSRYFTVTNQ